jgi:hypothetical protein
MTTVVQLDQNSVAVPVYDTQVVTTDAATTAVTEVTRTAVVISGSLGPGITTLSSLLDVSFSSASEGDLLTKQGSLWTNTPRVTVTDGGNF